MADVEDCMSCRFWSNLPDEGNGGIGRCRRRGPSIFAVTFIDGLDRVQTETCTEWPITGEADWCGEFEAASVKDDIEAAPLLTPLCHVCGDGDKPEAFENATGTCPACGSDGLPF